MLTHRIVGAASWYCRVKLIDWCECHQGESIERLIDPYYDVFARTGGSVTIRW